MKKIVTKTAQMMEQNGMGVPNPSANNRASRLAEILNQKADELSAIQVRMTREHPKSVDHVGTAINNLRAAAKIALEPSATGGQ